VQQEDLEDSYLCKLILSSGIYDLVRGRNDIKYRSTDIANTTVTAGTYGSSTIIPILSVDQREE